MDKMLFQFNRIGFCDDIHTKQRRAHNLLKFLSLSQTFFYYFLRTDHDFWLGNVWLGNVWLGNVWLGIIGIIYLVSDRPFTRLQNSLKIKEYFMYKVSKPLILF